MIVLTLIGVALAVTPLFSLVGLFEDSANVEWQVSWEPITPYKELYELERLRSSRTEYSFVRD